MSRYADTSFVVSCYVPDANAAKARAWVAHSGSPLFFTALHELETRNALKLGIFRGLYSALQAKAAWSNVESDLRSGRLVKTAINWRLALWIAAGLSEKHSSVLGSRSLDLLHIAAAKTLRATEFISFDNRQRAVAAAAGFRIAP